MVRVGILTISDRSSRGEREDRSGPALREKVIAMGWLVEEQDIIPDEIAGIKETLTRWADSGRLDVVLTSGGTGFASRDVTPEATNESIERNAPGLAARMASASLKITPHAMLSRAVTGIRGNTLIVNLPGSPKAALENLEAILPVLPHAVQLLQEDAGAEAGHQL